MRTSRFMLSLIAATALGLSAVGCDSSSSGAVASTSDISIINNNNGAEERRNLREYMLVAQRGLETFSPDFDAGQSAPADAENPVIAGPGDSGSVDPAALFELAGIGDQPRPNARPVTPGGDGATPNTPGDLVAEDTAGYHVVSASPTGTYAIGISRAKNRGFAGDSIRAAYLQVFALREEQPLDVAFPPNLIFDDVADPIPIRFFNADQGEFVSGIWSSNGAQFYASVNQAIVTYSFDGTIGRIDEESVTPFPAGPGATPPINNAAQMIASRDGAFVYALDNANGAVLSFARNPANGTLGLVNTTPVVSDPRGMTMDRTGTFLYVAGRTSGQLAGYRVNGDGTFTAIDVFPELGFGPIPFSYGEPLGDVAANPQFDQLALSNYIGSVQTFNINPTTGALAVTGPANSPLGNSRNSANIEFEPTGRFIVAAYEHDFDAFQPFVKQVNGWPFDEGVVFANTDSANNGAGQPVFSATPNQDRLGRVVYVQPTDEPFTGDLQIFRIQADGSPRVEDAIEVANPFGLSFFQKVYTPPSGEGPIVP